MAERQKQTTKSIINCLNSDIGNSDYPRELELSFSTKSTPNEMIVLDSDTINLSLSRIKSMQTLKLCNPVTSCWFRWK